MLARGVAVDGDDVGVLAGLDGADGRRSWPSRSAALTVADLIAASAGDIPAFDHQRELLRIVAVLGDAGVGAEGDFARPARIGAGEADLEHCRRPARAFSVLRGRQRTALPVGERGGGGQQGRHVIGAGLLVEA